MENYQFIKQIGQGSYGEIWLVKCSKTRKKHVLKRIDLHQVSKREQRAAHLEAKLLSTIKHPNIVTYLDSFHNSSGSLFLVMNYCECGDLYTFIKNQNGVYFEEKQIVHWFVQICLALKYLHDRNILHRNLKTRNIFLTKNKIIKVGDLGISRVLSIANEMTATLIETPYYISPEIFSGKSFNEKSDIWALGCCTYEITTLKHPFIAQDIHTLLHKIMKRQLPAIPEMYSSELYDIILMMLNTEPENRPCVTQLLLNDYIRRYILLILQDDSKSPDSHISEKCELPMERSKSKSDLSLAVPKDGLHDIQRSMSSYFLPRNRSMNSKTPCAASKEKIISVPDVNGNGDGNDNSQHRKIRNFSRKFDCDDANKNKNVENNCKSIKIDEKVETRNANNVSNDTISSPHNSRSSESNRAVVKQKMKSEISFQILNNLAYSLHRRDNFKEDRNYINSENSALEFSNINKHNFKLSEGGKQLTLDIKTALDDLKETENPISKGKTETILKLPQIKHETKNKEMPNSITHTKHLPLVKSQNYKGKRLSLKKPASKTDTLLLKQTNRK